MSKIALVTGASRGIGAAIAKRLAADGFAVAVNYQGNTAAANAVVAEIGAAGGKAVAIQATIGKKGEAKRLFDETEAQLGRPDILVNNAGIMRLTNLAEVDDAEIDEIVSVNLTGLIQCLREGMNRLPDGGRIINFSSTVVAVNFPTYGVYAATKAGVETLSAIAAKEMRGRNVTVNTVAPGPTATDLFLDGKTEERVAELAKANPLERLGQPEDIANVVSFLAGPDGGWVNGQTLRANGGMA